MVDRTAPDGRSSIIWHSLPVSQWLIEYHRAIKNSRSIVDRLLSTAVYAYSTLLSRLIVGQISDLLKPLLLVIRCNRSIIVGVKSYAITRSRYCDREQIGVSHSLYLLRFTFQVSPMVGSIVLSITTDIH